MAEHLGRLARGRHLVEAKPDAALRERGAVPREHRQELVAEAAALGLTAIAVSDHDTVEAVADCVTAGADRIAVQPFFLFPGAHVLEDIPLAVENLRRAYAHVEILLAPHLGGHPKLAEIARDRLQEVL